MNQGNLLIIAGSDSSGGAGVQADIKTATKLGIYAATVITAVTAQNTKGAEAVEILPAWLVKKQLEAVTKDIHFKYIKIGMLGSKKIIDVVWEFLEKTRSKKVIWDPVMKCKNNVVLLPEEDWNNLKLAITHHSFVVTPNIKELEILSRHDNIETEQDLLVAAKKINGELYAYVYAKAGHVPSIGADILIDKQHEATIYKDTLIESTNIHGAGCSLSTAIACYLIQGESIPAACKKAKSFVRKAILKGQKIGRGKVHPVNLNYLP